MTFGEKLKKLRTDNQMTQEQLAEKIFVSRTAISKWETDRGYPGIDSLKALSDLFQIKIDDLISGADAENKKLLDEKLAVGFISRLWRFWASRFCRAADLLSETAVLLLRQCCGGSRLRHFRLAFQAEI